MNRYQPKQPEKRSATLWRSIVLLLLLLGLAFAGWVDLRHTSPSSNSGFVAGFHQQTLANLRANYRSLLEIQNPSGPNTTDGDNERHGLGYFSLLSLPLALLHHTAGLHYLTLLINNDGKYQLPISRAPPQH